MRFHEFVIDVFRTSLIIQQNTRSVRLLRLLGVVAMIPCFFSSQAQAASYRVGPPPRWVTAAPTDLAAETKDNEDQSGSLTLLTDYQCRVTSVTTERYFHQMTRILNASGLENLSDIEMDFEPSYEKLTIHYIRLLRGNATIDALKSGQVKVIQKETDLYQRIYNGTLTALVILHDVRVGDIIDYSYTISGENPVLGGRFADTIFLSNSAPARFLRRRILIPATRKLYLRKLDTFRGPMINNIGNDTEYLWELRDVEEPGFEGDTPGWFRGYPIIQMSEFQDWSSVATWSSSLFKTNSALPGNLLAQIAQWRKDHSELKDRALAAVRFVQDEIRYMGIELGRYSHQPAEPGTVFNRRFGDCKDKSHLLSAILRELGVDAKPALVNTTFQNRVADYQPSPYAFDHCIVKVILDGKACWIDPTLTLERGDLTEHAPPRYGKALVVSPESDQLEDIPEPATATLTTVIKETYRQTEENGPTILEVTTTYRGADADYARYAFSQESKQDIGQRFLNFYAQESPNIEAEGGIEVEDDTIANVVIVKENYVIQDFWSENIKAFKADSVAGSFVTPSVSKRRTPLYVPFPRSIGHTIEVINPVSMGFYARSETVSSDAIRFEFKARRENQRVVLSYELRTLSDHVPPEQVGRHLAAVDRIMTLSTIELNRGFAGFAGLGLILKVGVAVILGGLGAAAIVALFIYKKTSRKQRQPEIRRGESPEAAIEISHEDNITARLDQTRCSCGAPQLSQT